MIDSGTGLTILGSAIGGAKVLEKILGPTADYVGNQIKEWTEKKVNNTSNIFHNAEKKLGTEIDKPGRVPPKVLKGILEEGSWCEEELQVEYFGGVLASSRSGISRDDRGAYFVSLVTRLSAYQLRTHYLIYTAIKNHFDGQDLNIGESVDRRKMEIFIPYSVYLKGMDFTNEEIGNFHTLMTHSIWGLNKEELVENFSYGPSEYLKKKFSGAEESGIIIQPSNLGVELFMWAFGYGQKSNKKFFATTTEFKTDKKIIIEKTMKTK
ncbi:hypothetical protein [Polaribacter sargassicola]|uniref:hypothetical protein n=1 Tax=Polaribacter sargassicola TaxID=2836891 RepID=UPI001F25874A|nr:hypothetical protein [Polaribacter sp. DS7-9]MCG1034768.1 hypothetical protein [Polaribacter sp. DS7-9]